MAAGEDDQRRALARLGTGFMVVGGEWFMMWQSAVWNGQEAAFRFYVTLLGVLIYVNQRDTEADAGW